MVNTIIHAYKLDEIGKKCRLIFSITSDGAKITNNINQVVVGFKVSDIGAVHLLTSKLIKPQTRNVCWPTRIMMGKETR